MGFCVVQVSNNYMVLVSVWIIQHNTLGMSKVIRLGTVFITKWTKKKHREQTGDDLHAVM